MLSGQLSLAQDPFTAAWRFDNTTGGSSSHANIGTGGADLVGVGVSNLPNAAYVTGVSQQAINVINWSQTGGCNFSEYVQVTVQPLNGQRMTLSSMSFYINHSVSNSGNTGPQSVRVRSSLDGYGGDLTQSGVSASFQNVSVGLSGSYANLTNAVTFRIHACPPNGGGALRLDELTVNGTVTSAPLPVSLLYFRAQPQLDNRITLNWATTWERDADRFEIQRSRSLNEFGTIGQLPARGTTETRQLYSFSDDWPDSGTTYYRLRQVDTDGTTTYSNIVAAVLDDSTPTLSVLDSETPGTLTVRGRNLSGALFSVVSMTGQIIPIIVQTGANGAIGLYGKLGTGLYVVRAEIGGMRLVQRALVR